MRNIILSGCVSLTLFGYLGCGSDGGSGTLMPGTPGTIDSGTGNPQPDAQTSMPQSDAEAPLPEQVKHVPMHSAHPGSADLVLGDGTVIDSQTHTINGASVPEGAAFEVVQHEGQGLVLLSVLRVRNLTIEPGATVRVTGSRPLVVIAANTITVDGVIDASARAHVPGPGGMGPEMGSGAGDEGDHQDGSLEDSGGSGAGYATIGGAGGIAECLDSTEDCGTDSSEEGGMAYGDDQITVLMGGSGGGPGSLECAEEAAMVRTGGAGGGVVQLYAGSAVTIGADGGINVGGGGGGGGGICTTAPTDMGSGGGGGSGGSIYVQAPSVTLDGVLAANGGGGGGGAGLNAQNSAVMGQDGQDGQLASTPAAGGARGGITSGNSGAGGAGGTSEAPQPGYGVTAIQGNGAGGGGGAAGRIVIATSKSMAGSGISSPEAVRVSY